MKMGGIMKNAVLSQSPPAQQSAASEITPVHPPHRSPEEQADNRRAQCVSDVWLTRVSGVLYVMSAIAFALMDIWPSASSGEVWLGVAGAVLLAVVGLGMLITSFFPAAMLATRWSTPDDGRSRAVALRAGMLQSRIMDGTLIAVVIIALIVHLTGSVYTQQIAMTVALTAAGLAAVSYMVRIATVVYVDRTDR